MRACVCSVDGELGTTTRDKGPPIWSRIIVRARPQRKRAAAGRQTGRRPGRQAGRQVGKRARASHQADNPCINCVLQLGLEPILRYLCV